MSPSFSFRGVCVFVVISWCSCDRNQDEEAANIKRTDRIGDHFNANLKPSSAKTREDPVTPLPLQDHLSSATGQTLGPATNVPPYPVINSCQAFIDVYSDAAANYSRCAIQFARPLRFCENCIEEYLVADHLYNTIMGESGPKDFDGRLCRDLVLNSDRVQIIKRTGNFIEDLWQTCSCKYCFIDHDTDPASTTLSNHSVEFGHKYNDTWECFDLHESKNETDHHNVCSKCRGFYDDLNHFYEELDSLHHGEVCMDIQDMLNSTRSKWSSYYKCTLQPGDLMPVLVLSGFFCLLPVIFYIGNRIHGARLQKKLMRQRRLRDANACLREADMSINGDDPIVHPSSSASRGRSVSAPPIT